MPHFGFNIGVVLRPSHFAGSGLRFSTRVGGGDRLAGLYLVFPEEKRCSLVRIPRFHNEIRVRVEGDWLRVKHDASFFGAGYQIRYRLSSEDARTRVEPEQIEIEGLHVDSTWHACARTSISEEGRQ